MKAWFLVTVAIGGCVYNANDLCGDNMAYDAKLEACVCTANSVVDELGCTPCSADEVVVAGVCSCAPGSEKNADDVCAVVAGLGDSCSDASACTDAHYPICAPASAGVTTAGTCTRTCSADTDCGDAYTCATWEAEPYCRKFGGLGTSCVSSDDCAGTDAKFCDTYQSHTCIVAGCSLDDSDCPRGTLCCDFSQYGFGTLCAGACL